MNNLIINGIDFNKKLDECNRLLHWKIDWPVINMQSSMQYLEFINYQKYLQDLMGKIYGIPKEMIEIK